MEYTQEELATIEEMAKNLSPVPQIALELGLNEDMMALDISTHGHPARAAFMRGMYATAEELRAKNLELARACSPTAMEQCFRDLQNMMMSL
jgi:hypothetical protein